MQRPIKSALEALLELLDPTSTEEALAALAAILSRQAERTDPRREAA